MKNSTMHWLGQALPIRPNSQNRLRGPNPTLPHARAGHSLTRGPARQPGRLALCFLPRGLHVGPLVQLVFFLNRNRDFFYARAESAGAWPARGWITGLRPGGINPCAARWLLTPNHENFWATATGIKGENREESEGAATAEARRCHRWGLAGEPVSFVAL
jgi:hypothetical protein